MLVPFLIRSEEHTSELQSLRHVVCRLLLEKKKNYLAADHDLYNIKKVYHCCKINPDIGPGSLEHHLRILFFFFNDTATTEIYTLSLHDALPISVREDSGRCKSGCRDLQEAMRPVRSEEHTSELQSLRHLVCSLLLEKKNNKDLERAFEYRHKRPNQRLRSVKSP